MADAGENFDMAAADTLEDETLFDEISEDGEIPGDIDTSGDADTDAETDSSDTEKDKAEDKAESPPKDKPEKKPENDLEARAAAYDKNEADGQADDKSSPDTTPPKQTGDDAGSAGDQGKEKGTPPASSPSPTFTKESVGEYLGLVTEKDLPDEDITVGNETVNLKAFAEDFPDVYAPVKVMAAAIAQQVIDKALADGRIAGRDTVKSYYQEEQNRVATEQAEHARFYGPITEKHPDWYEMTQSAEFTDWLKQQSAAVQRMAGNLQAPEDGIAILDSFVESQRKINTDKARTKKKAKDDLLSGVSRSKKTTTESETEIDAEQLFNKISDEAFE